MQPLRQLVGQIGRQTAMDAQSRVVMNRSLVENIVRYGESAIPVLFGYIDALLQQPALNRLAIVEALYTGQRLAENKVNGVNKLYGVTCRLNTVKDPLILTYLGGFYEKLNEVESFGPTLSALINMAVTQYPQPNLRQNPTLDAPESLGGAVLEMIAQKTARETVKQLLPLLRRDLAGNAGLNFQA